MLGILNKLRKSGFYVNFNRRNRDKWVRKIASQVPGNSKVLDAGAGTCRYRKVFQHCEYFTQDFCQAEGGSNGKFKYGKIDYISDITEIPVPDESFDVVLCTEVLEHISEPIKAIKEFSRILKRGGATISNRTTWLWFTYDALSLLWWLHLKFL